MVPAMGEQKCPSLIATKAPPFIMVTLNEIAENLCVSVLSQVKYMGLFGKADDVQRFPRLSAQQLDI
jgi:hypothetical protein